MMFGDIYSFPCWWYLDLPFRCYIALHCWCWWWYDCWILFLRLLLLLFLVTLLLSFPVACLLMILYSHSWSDVIHDATSVIPVIPLSNSYDLTCCSVSTIPVVDVDSFGVDACFFASTYSGVIPVTFRWLEVLTVFWCFLDLRHCSP